MHFMARILTESNSSFKRLKNSSLAIEATFFENNENFCIKSMPWIFTFNYSSSRVKIKTLLMLHSVSQFLNFYSFIVLRVESMKLSWMG